MHVLSKFGLALGVVLFSILPMHRSEADDGVGNFLTGEAKVNVTKRYDGPKLSKPGKVMLHDFTAPTGDVTTDQSFAARMHRNKMLKQGVDDDSTPEVLVRQVQAAFSKTFADELKKLSIPLEKASGSGGTSADSNLIVEGEFIAINEGDETKRVAIGFGRGASSLKTHVTISSMAQGHLTPILEFDVAAESGKKPGFVATMGVGSIAIGAATGSVTDKAARVQADASRTAKAVAKQIKALLE